MSTQPPRSYTKLAIAIIVAALIIGSVAYLTISPGTRTITVTTYTSCDYSSTLYCVVFQQTGACSNPEFWGIPWSVTIGNTTEVQPPGTKLPLNNYGLGGTLNTNFTVIVFSLPDGHYDYNVSPSAGFFTPTTGSVSVDGTDVLVQIAYTGTSCTAVVTTSTSSALVTGSSVDSSDTYLTSCSISGAGQLQLRVVSDSTGAPVSGETINAVDTLGCNAETQVVYLDNFTVEEGGWLIPIFPNQAAAAGKLTFTLAYQGGDYGFSTVIPPMGISCVTLQVPSGNVTSTTTGPGGAPCWQ